MFFVPHFQEMKLIDVVGLESLVADLKNDVVLHIANAKAINIPCFKIRYDAVGK